MYPYGVVGNCQINGLVGDDGSLDWLCMPRPDGPPIFGKILDEEGGAFCISSMEGQKGVQSYIPNTNILETTFTQKNGAKYKIVDFCPRFVQRGRIFHPPMLFRLVVPLEGSPKIQVKFHPVDGWSKKPLKPLAFDGHLGFEGSNLRVATDMPLTYLLQGSVVTVQEPIGFALSWAAFPQEELGPLLRTYLIQTENYWKGWVKHCSIPSLFQDEVIRSALALKLHCFEDTGAILASLTTSLPEEREGVRNWDYRFCWLRDAYFSLSAFRNLGHFEEMEGFIRFLVNIAEKGHEEGLHPVYKLDTSLPLPEISHDNWEGFKKSKPVRSGNHAATHVQNDVYGEMILALCPIFFDRRFQDLRNSTYRDLLSKLANKCITFLDAPDAGLWEFRETRRIHSFSTLLNWVGLDRVESLVRQNEGRYNLETLLIMKARAEELLQKAVVDGSLRNSPDDPSHDASLALLALLRYPDKALAKKTVMEIYEKLAVKDNDEAAPAFFYRYLHKDDFGKPRSAFLACSFWIASAFARIGEAEMARYIVERTMEAQNHLGLFSEHYAPGTRTQLGNFPQAYSHVGLINAAFAVSPPWSDIL